MKTPERGLTFVSCILSEVKSDKFLVGSINCVSILCVYSKPTSSSFGFIPHCQHSTMNRALQHFARMLILKYPVWQGPLCLRPPLISRDPTL